VANGNGSPIPRLACPWVDQLKAILTTALALAPDQPDLADATTLKDPPASGTGELGATAGSGAYPTTQKWKQNDQVQRREKTPHSSRE
jgi:hypothetical protein